MKPIPLSELTVSLEDIRRAMLKALEYMDRKRLDVYGGVAVEIFLDELLPITIVLQEEEASESP